VPGLSTYTTSDNDAQLHVVVPQLEEHEAFNTSLQAIADDEREMFLEDYLAPENEAGDVTSWMSGTWTAVAVSAEMLGFELTTTFSPGASTATTHRMVWYDPGDGELLGWQDLLTDEAFDEVTAAVLAELEKADIDVDTDAVEQKLSEDDLAVGFSEAGELVFGFDSHTVAPGAAGAPAVALADPTDNGWLSDAGQAALDASLHPSPEDVPEPPEVPDQEEVDCSQEQCVALTFDDGPSASTTPELLDILAAEEVPATFFVLGSQAQAFGDLIAREVADGHEVGNHTWQHPDLSALSADQVREEVEHTNEVVAEVTGSEPTALRPPYGATNDTVAAVAEELGMAQVAWDIDTLDWQHHDPKQTVANAAEATAGSIVLVHDIHDTTIEAVPDVIETLREEGFTFVTVSDLLGQTTPGEVYYQGR